MATLTTFFILVDLISNCFETFCNFLILLCLRELYSRLMGLSILWIAFVTLILQ